MEVMERFRKVFRKFVGKSFNKDSKKDMYTMMALTYLLGKEGVNFQGNLYFHFKPDENGYITSERFVSRIKENDFEYCPKVNFTNNDLKVMWNLHNAIKDVDKKADVIITMAKIKHFQSKRGFLRAKDLKEAYLKEHKEDLYFEQALDAHIKVLDIKNTPTGKLIAKKPIIEMEL